MLIESFSLKLRMNASCMYHVCIMNVSQMYHECDILVETMDERQRMLRWLKSEKKIQNLEAKKSALLRLKALTSLRLNLFQQSEV